MKNSLERLVETYMVELFRTHPSLKGKDFRHSDSDSAAKPNVIIIEAKQGEDLLEGDQGQHGEVSSKIEVTVTYFSTSAKADTNDMVVQAINKSIRTAGQRKTKTQNTPGFLLRILNEEISSARSHGTNSRQREVMVPCLAGLIEGDSQN